jgi:hypothetical protein
VRRLIINGAATTVFVYLVMMGALATARACWGGAP